MSKFKKCSILCIILVCLLGISGNVFAMSEHDRLALNTIYKHARKAKKANNWSAHRGYAALVPENTELAFELAALCGAVSIEGDVRISKDGKLYMMHDSTVDGMTNGKGKIEKLSSGYIKNLEITSGPNRKKFNKIRVCTFDKYIYICKKYDKYARVDVKLASSEKIGKKICKQIYKTLKKYNMLDKACISLHRIGELKYMSKISNGKAILKIGGKSTASKRKKFAKIKKRAVPEAIKERDVGGQP